MKSWATPQSARDAPLYKPGAGGLIAEALSGGQSIKLRLLYDADDPKNAQICQRIKAQVEEASANKDGKPLVEIESAAVTAERFREKLHLEHDYDLALTTFDYRDDLYSLAGLLDPEAAGPRRRGTSWATWPPERTRPRPTAGCDARSTRSASTATSRPRCSDLTWDIHTLFNQRVPFVPLWQLDRFMVVHKDLKLHFENPTVEVKAEQLDPAVVFTGVEMWRLE